MSVVGCRCGNTLSNVDVPSENLLCVFPKKQVDEILRNNPIMKFWDFSMENEYSNYTFWFCPQCKRIYCFKNDCAKSVAVFKIGETITDVDYSDLEEVYAFLDTKIYGYTERDLKNKKR